MGEKTGIQWTNIPGYIGGTWNCWQGCTKVSAGCTNCYMYREKKRYGQDPATVKRSAPATFNLPARTKEPHAWFTCSWSDFFHPAAELWRREACQIIEENPQHLYLILTKRIEEAASRLPIGWFVDWPSNVWMGTTCENQEMADKRIPILLDIPAPVRFVSVEPMLGRVDIANWLSPRPGCDGARADKECDVCSSAAQTVDWVIVGGENGPNARKMNLDWARDLRDQC